MNKKNGLGKYLYTEWIVLIADYYISLRKQDKAFEVFFPIAVSVVCTYIYARLGIVFAALDGIVDVLPTAVSVLIGFTILLITLLLTGNGESVDRLKKTTIDKKLRGKEINLFQGLHIQFSHSLFTEIELLIMMMSYLFFKGIGISEMMGNVFLCIETYLTLNILMSIIRGITNIYFSFYREV